MSDKSSTVKQNIHGSAEFISGGDQYIKYSKVVEKEKEPKELLTFKQRGILVNLVRDTAKEFSSRFESEAMAQKDLWDYLSAQMHYDKGVATWYRQDYDEAVKFVGVWRSNFENEIKRKRLANLLYKSVHRKVLEKKALYWFGESFFQKLKFDELLKLAKENEKLVGVVEINVNEPPVKMVPYDELESLLDLLSESRESIAALQESSKKNQANIKFLRIGFYSMLAASAVLAFWLALSLQG